MNLATTHSSYATRLAADTVRIERLLPGPIERVWAFLTESGLRRQWLAAGDMTLVEGAPFELVWRNDELSDPPGHRPEGFPVEHRMESTITALDPPRRLAFSWRAGEVSIELEPRGDQVLLTLVHTGISDRDNLLKIGAGWHAHLDVLVARANGETPAAPFWDTWSGLREEYDRRLA
jgi:uncharacterized protein YndB with AHSA1/START domain